MNTVLKNFIARGLALALVVVAVVSSVASGGAPYNCPWACQEHQQALARHGMDPDTGNAGVPEDKVCTHDAIVEARNCEECIDAITDTYRVWTSAIGCDCPAASANEEQSITYIDRSCEQKELEFNEANCATYEFDKHSNPAQCQG